MQEYIIHKVDKLWKEVEDLKKRIEELERKMAEMKFGVSAVQELKKFEIQPAKPVEKVSEHMDPVLRVLKERGPMNIIQLNEALRNIGIAETVRDTLFKRVKKLMDEGKVGFDEKTQNFFVR